MTNVTISLPESHAVSSRGTSVTVDVSKLSPDIVAKLVLHGLTQKIGDNAASALADAGFKGMKYADLSTAEQEKVGGFALTAMQSVADALANGDWGIERVGGAGVTAEVAERRIVLRTDVKAAWVADHDETAWKTLEAGEIADLCDELYDAQDDDTRAAIDEVVTERLAAKLAAKKAASGLVGLIKRPAK